MPKKKTDLKAQSTATAPDQANGAAPTSPELATLLGRVEQMLHEGDPGKALEQVARAKVTSPWAMNALGVCQLRLGNAKVAVDVFRGLVLAPGGIVLRDDVPTVFKTNYATSLLVAGNLGGCLSVLSNLRDEDDPCVERLKSAIGRWKEGLTFWQKVNWCLGGQPERPVTLDFPPGDL
jgi:hypothetical protein